MLPPMGPMLAFAFDSAVKTWTWVVAVGAILLGLVVWWPFLILGALAAVVGIANMRPDSLRKPCPECAEYVPLEARVCSHCGHPLAD
jgi:hypothetical protein